MKKIFNILILSFFLCATVVSAKNPSGKDNPYPKFTRADSLHGTLMPSRACYDVRFYDISVDVFPETKSIVGEVSMDFLYVDSTQKVMQIDLASRLKIDDIAIDGVVIENYTRESGVRELEKKINKVMRKIALKSARDGYQLLHDIKPADVRDYLGAPEYSRDKYQGNEYAGVVTGLAWTAVGGEILFVETSLSKGKGGRLTLTGNLGDVMKESAMLALEYLKAHTCLLGIAEDIFENWNIHVHVPEGAIPKDGPSAGVTISTALLSALTITLMQLSIRWKLT